MKFTKMHGIGNDYIYVNCFKEHIDNPPHVARVVSDRRFGIGSDGLIMICPSEVADFRMEMYNLDGSEGKMCGNGIRCIGKYVYDYGLTDKTEISVETKSGIKYLTLYPENGKIRYVRVNMGNAIIRPREIPVDADGEDFILQEITAGDVTCKVTCVSMGNPHAVTFVDEVDSLNLEKIGPAFENHPLFPDKINTEFVKVIDSTHIKMRVWERGSGETLACGTGACASAVASVLCGHCPRGEEITVSLRGGELKITWQEDGQVIMIGPATKVFDGEIEISDMEADIVPQ